MSLGCLKPRAPDAGVSAARELAKGLWVRDAPSFQLKEVSLYEAASGLPALSLQMFT